MESTISRPQASFSFARVGMVGGYYYPILKKQIWIYPALSLAAGIVTFMLEYFSEYFFGRGMSSFFSGVITTALSFMFYWAPCVLNNDGREIEVSLPALWSEKATFLVGYFFLAMPLLVFGPYILSRVALVTLFLHEQPILELQGYAMSISLAGTNIGLGSIDSLVALSTAFCVMMCSRRRSFARAAVLSIVSIIGLGMVSGILVFIRLLNIGFEKVASYAESSKDVAVLMESLNIDWYVLLASGICLAYTLLMIVLSVRSIKRIQI